MKLLLIIDDRYKEPEIHLCSDKKTGEIIDLRDFLEDTLFSKITLYKNQEARTAAAYEIVRLYSENKKVYARTDNDTYEVRERLYSLEETLNDRGFVRISNSEIVNSAKITKLDMSFTGTIRISLKNGDETYVSRRYVSRIKEVLG